jgi:hypothetical protein
VATVNPLDHARQLLDLGKRAVSYYVDTGECVFCDADDVAGVPHGEGCTVGVVSGVELTPERVEEKRWQREVMDAYHRGDLTRERWNELLARKPEAS